MKSFKNIRSQLSEEERNLYSKGTYKREEKSTRIEASEESEDESSQEEEEVLAIPEGLEEGEGEEEEEEYSDDSEEEVIIKIDQEFIEDELSIPKVRDGQTIDLLHFPELNKFIVCGENSICVIHLDPTTGKFEKSSPPKNIAKKKDVKYSKMIKWHSTIQKHLFLVSDNEGGLYCYNAKTEKYVTRILQYTKEHEDQDPLILGMCQLSPDSLVIGTNFDEVLVVSVSKKKVIKKLKEQDPIYPMTIKMSKKYEDCFYINSGESRHFFSFGDFTEDEYYNVPGNPVTLVDYQSNYIMKSFSKHFKSSFCFDLIWPNGKEVLLVASYYRNSTSAIHFYNTTTEKVYRMIKIKNTNIFGWTTEFTSFGVVRNSILMCGLSNGDVVAYDLNKKEKSLVMKRKRIHTRMVKKMFVLGKKVVSCSLDGTVKLVKFPGILGMEVNDVDEEERCGFVREKLEVWGGFRVKVGESDLVLSKVLFLVL